MSTGPWQTIVGQRVLAARAGENPAVVVRLPSGWLVMCDKQVVPGQLILLADPVVASLNDLSEKERQRFLADMAAVGDALLAVTGCVRVNYEILGNTDPALHAHIVPRYGDEPADKRAKPIWLYDWAAAADFSVATHGPLMRELAAVLERRAT